jgi:hypothetical protein
MRKIRGLLTKILSLATLGALSAHSLGQTKGEAIANCIAFIRSSVRTSSNTPKSLKNPADLIGSITVNADPIYFWIEPYFGSQACLALIVNGAPQDKAAETAWLQWYAKHELANGSIDDWTNDANTSILVDTGKRDSIDSYAAAFLQCCEAYQTSYGSLPSNVLPAAEKAFGAMYKLLQPDGLTIYGDPSNPVEYLQDNCEAFGGAVSARKLFGAYNLSALVAEAIALRSSISRAYAGLLVEDPPPPPKGEPQLPALYAYARERGILSIQQLGTPSFGATTGLANLYAFAWISTGDPNCWSFIANHVVADSGPAPRCPVERFYIASLRQSNSAVTVYFEALTIEAAAAFSESNAYVQRAAISALALLKGAQWMPNKVDGDQ